MNQSMAIDDLVSVAQAEAMGELDAPMMAIVLSSDQSYDLPINSLETDADKARWGLILRAAREHVEADAVAVLYPAWTTIRRKPAEGQPEPVRRLHVRAVCPPGSAARVQRRRLR